MKKSELRVLRKLYMLELDRLKQINELLKTDSVKQFINLARLDVEELFEIDCYKILSEMLKKVEVTQTNGIYVCTGAFCTESVICYEDTKFYNKPALFDSERAEYRVYSDIENCSIIKAYTSIDYVKDLENNVVLTSEFEKNNIVLNPYNSNENFNGYDEVRMNFFMNSIEQGQKKSKKMILGKYKRM